MKFRIAFLSRFKKSTKRAQPKKEDVRAFIVPSVHHTRLLTPSQIPPEKALLIQQLGPYLAELPPELRNHIYTLAFNVDSDQTRDKDGYINLLNPNPPSKALLLTCRSIHNEAAGLYLAAYRTYWRTNPFIIPQNSNFEKIANLPPELVNQITQLRIHVRRGVVVDLLLLPGIWQWISPIGPAYFIPVVKYPHNRLPSMGHYGWRGYLNFATAVRELAQNPTACSMFEQMLGWALRERVPRDWKSNWRLLKGLGARRYMGLVIRLWLAS